MTLVSCSPQGSSLPPEGDLTPTFRRRRVASRCALGTMVQGRCVLLRSVWDRWGTRRLNHEAMTMAARPATSAVARADEGNPRTLDPLHMIRDPALRSAANRILSRWSEDA